MADKRLAQTQDLMAQFARATGLLGSDSPRRYLWTDAYAVCNYLQLYHRYKKVHYLELALELVDQVHRVLGQHRADDKRQGWLSALTEAEGRHRPTAGGLRIGKPLPERMPNEPYNEREEWDRDGQYYHYLTKWMHALHQVAVATGEGKYQRWAVELALVAHRGFMATQGPPRLYWKMSTALTYPLVPSSGHHDPLDGLITCLVLRSSAADNASVELTQAMASQLDQVISELGELCHNRSWMTDDPLGIGGLLFDAGRLLQLHTNTQENHYLGLLHTTLDTIAAGLEHYNSAVTLRMPATDRLAFRELGLSIGLHCIDLMYRNSPAASTLLKLDKLSRFVALAQVIEEFWLEPKHRSIPAWREHEHINTVMLATSLAPEAFLTI